MLIPALIATLINRIHERIVVSPGALQASFAETQSDPGDPSRKTASSRLSSLVSMRTLVPSCCALGGVEMVAIGSEVILSVGEVVAVGTPLTAHTSMLEVEVSAELTAAM